MKKKFNVKAKIFSLALLAAGATATVPAVPQTVMAAETATTQNTNGWYEIVRKINIYYVNSDGSTTFGGSAPYTGYVSNKNMKFTFPEVKVADLFTDGLGYWKSDKETIPSVTATYDNPPEEVNIYLTKDTNSYTEESKTITRTVKYYYVDASGNKSNAGSYKDSVTFKRPGYIDASGNKVMDDWSGSYTFKEITVPEKTGYTANMAKVPAKTVKPTDSDFEVEVLYSKLPTKTEIKDITRTINYIYKDTNKTFKTYTQRVTLSREVFTDANGKTVVVRDWNTGKFSAHNVETVSGYTADKQIVAEAAVTSGSANATVNVYFTKSEDNVKDQVTFFVTFTDGQGKTLKTEEVESGKAATAPAAPTRSGYTFAGWDKSFNKITAPTTVNAKWTKNNESVSETKTVERTIYFVKRYTDGRTENYGYKKQSATFSRTGYIDTKGNKVMPDWPQQTWEAVKVPTLAGFKPEKAEVPAVTFTPDKAPGDMTVYLDQLPTKTEYKTVKRTIKFVGKNLDGTTSSLGSATQSVTINREVYTDENGKTQVKRDWNTGTLNEYMVPDRAGYTKPQESVPEVKVTSKSKDITVNIYYSEKVSLFKDVTDPKDIFYNPVYWAVKKGIATGFSDNTFRPNASCTRGQAVSFLWKLAGSPKVSNVDQYKDVSKGHAFYDAILWAKAQNIVTGFEDGTFRPNKAVTRGQAASMLWRYMGRPAVRSDKRFNDMPSTNHMFYDPISWVCENNIATGYSGFTFKMDYNCTRGQMIRFIYNAVN